MKRYLGWMVPLLVVAATACGADDKDALLDVPYYFIAIHNEPHHDESSAGVQQDYQTLKQMVARADQYGIKLTLMFTPQWVNQVLASAAGKADLQAWQDAGHEISAHHHSIYHGNWDGYSDYSQAEAVAQRKKQNKKPESYLGTLTDYMAKLYKLNPKMRSGCVNDEADKRALPDAITIDTCSGFANYGEVGRRAVDSESTKGRNDYISVGTYAGIPRRWLTHYQITTDQRQRAGQAVFEQLDGTQAFGAVTHSIADQAPPFYSFLQHITGLDPGAARSRTVTEIVEGGLLPEQTLSAELINTRFVPPSGPTNVKCGDGECDPVEQANPAICPADCP